MTQIFRLSVTNYELLQKEHASCFLLLLIRKQTWVGVVRWEWDEGFFFFLLGKYENKDDF